MTKPAPLLVGERVWIAMSGQVVGKRYNLRERLTGIVVDVPALGLDPNHRQITVPQSAIRRVRR